VSTPLVSIVVPAYNHESLVEDCLRSAAAQQWPELELIVIDDVSRDGTLARAQRLASEPAVLAAFRGRVRVERNPENLGAHRTLNRALGMATGEYVGVLNSDDRYAPGRVAALARKLQEGAHLAFSGVRVIDEAGRDVSATEFFALRLGQSQRSLRAFPSVGFALLRHNVGISTGNLFFRRSLFDRVGGFRPLLYCHDWDFLLRSVLLTEPVYVDEPLYEYRLHGTNSYQGLAGVAARETEAVLTAYFSHVQRGRFENALAPAPANWPGTFEAMLSALHLRKYWDQARRCAVE
jgi:glycosyltransferase involved in cell wall biosynthesis